MPVSQTCAYASNAWLPRIGGSASSSVYRSGVSAGIRNAAQHRRVAVPEREVDDRASAVPERPEHADGLGEAVEQRPEAGRSLLAEGIDELRVLAPGLRLELVARLAHA